MPTIIRKYFASDKIRFGPHRQRMEIKILRVIVISGRLRGMPKGKSTRF